MTDATSHREAPERPANFTPRETVSELDRYIIGQDKAKRAVAVALRNRWRRSQVAEDLRDEIAPKNIIMIGPTGVGKTEIARRLAKLAKAPFIKVEASKFTEVGYVGRDVESMIRDLVELAIKLVREERAAAVRHRAAEQAEDRLVDALCRQKHPAPGPTAAANGDAAAPQGGPIQFGPILVTPPPGGQFSPMQMGAAPQAKTGTSATESERDVIRKALRDGELEDEPLEVEVQAQGNPFISIFGQNGMEEMEFNLRDMMGSMGKQGAPGKKRSATVAEARGIFERQEADKLVDMDRVQREALLRTEQSGIVFLDEIDKVATAQGGKTGPDVSREGVQRDLLPIVEGSTVTTKYGPVKTDHILFIAAGAFHVSSVSDLIPELQGRFPIRVELEALEEKDLVRILTEPRTALTKQYRALLNTEGLDLEFADDAVTAIASYAAEANRRSENIGARRLHTVLEALLEEISFTAPEQPSARLVIDEAYVKKTLDPILSSEELARYIL